MKIIDDNGIAAIAIGFSHYVDIGKPQDAVIFYETATRVRMRLPGASASMTGDWHLLPDGYFVKWQEGPAGKWQIASEPGAMTYIDPVGNPAGKITRIAPGNPAAI